MARGSSFLREPPTGPADCAAWNRAIIDGDGFIDPRVIEYLFDNAAGVAGPLCTAILHTWSSEAEALLRSAPLLGTDDELVVDRECW